MDIINIYKVSDSKINLSQYKISLKYLNERKEEVVCIFIFQEK